MVTAHCWALASTPKHWHFSSIPIFFLYIYRISGQNITIKGYLGATEELSSKLQILNEQKTYEITVFASSDLGRSEASLQIDANRRSKCLRSSLFLNFNY